MRLFRRRPKPFPPAPENVRAVLADGREIPLDLVYAGQDEDGVHMWHAAWTIGQMPVAWRVDVWPGRTGIELTFPLAEPDTP